MYASTYYYNTRARRDWRVDVQTNKRWNGERKRERERGRWMEKEVIKREVEGQRESEEG